ncbi:MAG: ferrous iron transport protein B [Ruminococcaceae bacterium]|nr:ferrous iron transport protein B [Oscillospiraceae bacterium]
MGLTARSLIRKMRLHQTTTNNVQSADTVIALAGNPNVGKSTVFNALTGMHQHTGNWPGKTVGNAQGTYTYKNKKYMLVDIPGAYSLFPHSAEEEIARDYICFGNADTTIVVCDATCLQRNLNLVLQILEITSQVIVCVNLIDEAARHGIHIDCDTLSQLLGVPVVATNARRGKGLKELTDQVHEINLNKKPASPMQITYQPAIEEALSLLIPRVQFLEKKISPRWLALRLLDSDDSLFQTMNRFWGVTLTEQKEISIALQKAKKILNENLIDETHLRDTIVANIYQTSESICNKVVRHEIENHHKHQLSVDRFLTNRMTGIPVMLLLLLFVLWLTIVGANYPSAALSELLFGFQNSLSSVCYAIHMPNWLHGALVLGVYRVLAWVISVMLPPMAIFFPLFTLLEDVGYLPRVAFNLDHCFKKCCACGKQALTMCMGFGCNAVGVVGCRIIDSPRERLIAILTNSFVPCNGRYPTLIAIITMFFVTRATGIFSTAMSALLLTSVIVLGIVMTMLTSRFLSQTLLKGVPSSFTLELPPYRRPQIGKVIIRSIFDRTLFVLGRAVAIAAPAGLIIYIMANFVMNGGSLLSHCAAFLDPFARLLGLDGVILIAFILGFPANEIVIPIAMMAYMSTSTLEEFESLASLRTLLVDNGWTWLTATCTMIFSLMHWPCSTTLISIRKETKSWFYTVISFLLPTITGMLFCFMLATITRLLGGP